jgi:hypothetical protein
MRRFILAVFVLVPAWASAQGIRYYPSQGGSGSGAPTDAQYVVAASDGTLSAERVCTDTTTIDCDAGTAGQMKFNLLGATFTDPLLGPTGCTNPAYAYTADTDAGPCLTAAGDVQLQSNASGTRAVVRVTSSGVAQLGMFDAGAAPSRVEIQDNQMTWTLNGTAIFRADDTLSTGFMVSKGGSTAAVARTITAGTGISMLYGDGQSGNPTVSVDDATTPQYAQGTADPPATCQAGRDIYTETDAGEVYYCRATNTWDLIYTSNTTVAVADGGTGLSSGTSGGVLAFTGTGTLASSGALTANLPVIGGGAGVAPSVGTRSGNTTQYVTTTGTQTSGDCVKIDANGNHVANGSACGGSSTFDPSTTVQLVEEFVAGYAANGYIGTHGMGIWAESSGTFDNVAGATAHPGLLRLNSHATNDNSGAIVSFLNASGAEIDYDAGDWAIDALVLVGSNSTAITNAAIYVGLSSSAQALLPHTYGIYLRRDSDRSDTTFIAQICSTGCSEAGDNGTISRVVASTITPSAGSYYRFRVRRATSGVGGNPTIYMRVNDETELTFCSSGCDENLSSIPSGATMVPVIAYFTRTTTGVLSADADYLALSVSGMTRY